MKIIFTAALAASLLCGSAVMAQPGNGNQGRGNSGDQADKKDQKANDAQDNRGKSQDHANGGPRALSAPDNARPQAARDRAAPGVQDNQPPPVNPAPPA